MTGLSTDEILTILTALRDYRRETDRYLLNSTFEPCAPGCVNCEGKVRHFANVNAGLQARRDLIVTVSQKVRALLPHGSHLAYEGPEVTQVSSVGITEALRPSGAAFPDGPWTTP